VLVIGKQPIRTQYQIYQVFEFLGTSINCYGRHPLRTLLSLPGISLIYILPLIASEDLQIPLTGSQLYLLHDLKLF